MSTTPGFVANGGKLWRSLENLRAAFAADMNDRIGRLPRVVTLVLPGPVSAWQIAQYLAGDDPSLVVATLNDLVVRNKISRPWRIEGSIEILR